MKIVFAALPAYGHLYPMLPLATACAAAGHDVLVATGEPLLDTLPLPTVPGIAVGGALGGVEEETRRNHPGVGDGPELVAYLFGETTARLVEPTLRALFERERPDLVVHESLNPGAQAAAAAFGIPATAFGIGLWSPLYALMYEVAGADPALPGGYLDPLPPSIQTPVPLPGSHRPIRPVAWTPPAQMPAWLPRSPRRRVYVTLGTVSYGAVEVLRRAVLAVADHDVDVLVAVGPAGDPALLGALPANVHTERFVPQAEVLRHVDLVVHHGGTGTMLGVLAEGLPQLVLPQGADQPFNAAAVERAGVGRALSNEAQTPATLAEAVGALLADGPERTAAKRVAEEIAALPAPSPALLRA
ncbi:glycosyltransferase [Actinophytocola oryzae]|uniref:MGT family glycosyltransferase n=1 Tax=Actinophytocola oryzae TaxID=502181 RepID=A0A4R7VRI5_9PSEU|nr:glycosyltransferase [Actinophytocola oryzae]TDV52098.1 MGT family glycosyltransferase [Actinophytocola oryzae]